MQGKADGSSTGCSEHRILVNIFFLASFYSWITETEDF